MAESRRLRGASAKLVVPAKAGTQNVHGAQSGGWNEGRGTLARPPFPIHSLREAQA